MQFSRLLHTEDVTTELQQSPTPIGTEQITEAEVTAAKDYEKRRPNFNFEEMGIPVSTTLIFREGGTALVTGPRKVRLGDDEMSLSAATRVLLGTEYNVAPGPYWTFNGRSLRDIYDETYS